MDAPQVFANDQVVTSAGLSAAVRTTVSENNHVETILEVKGGVIGFQHELKTEPTDEILSQIHQTARDVFASCGWGEPEIKKIMKDTPPEMKIYYDMEGTLQRAFDRVLGQSQSA